MASGLFLPGKTEDCIAVIVVVQAEQRPKP